MVSEQEMVFKSLKNLLKVRSISYADLAHKIELSESSVKRIFSQGMCSFSQLMQMCEVLNVSLFELVQSYQLELKQIEDFTLGAEREKFFEENENYFNFLRQYSLLGDIEKVKQENGLTSASTEKYTKKLLELGVLTTNAKGDISMVEEGFVKLSPHGKLRKSLEQKWSGHILAKAHQKYPDFKIQLGSTRLSKASLEIVHKQIEELFRKVKELGKTDHLTRDRNNNSPLGVCILTAPEIVNFPEKIPNL